MSLFSLIIMGFETDSQPFFRLTLNVYLMIRGHRCDGHVFILFYCFSKYNLLFLKLCFYYFKINFIYLITCLIRLLLFSGLVYVFEILNSSESLFDVGCLI